jgi:hypothetical protein
MASPGLSEIVTTTLRNRSGVIADNMSKNNAILYKLSKKGKVKPVSGGRTIVQELSYAENATFQYYSGYETLNISPSDVISAAEFDWKQASVAVSISGLEQAQNSGPDALLDLLEARIEVAEKTMQNNLSAGMYSDGTGSSGKQIGGLQLLVADTVTSGTVGGINQGTYTFWRNQTWQTTTEISSAASAANIQRCMNGLWMRTKRQSDQTDLILADANYYGFYWASLQAIQRITKDGNGMAAAGFTSLEYMGADVVLDGGIGGGCPANHMYFLNTDYLFWRPHRERNMVPLEKRGSINQDATVQLIIFMGNMTASNRELQGVIFQT